MMDPCNTYCDKGLHEYYSERARLSQFLEHVPHVSVHVCIFLHCPVYQLCQHLRPQCLQGLQLAVSEEGGGEEIVTEQPGSADPLLLGHTEGLNSWGELVQSNTTDRL